MQYTVLYCILYPWYLCRKWVKIYAGSLITNILKQGLTGILHKRRRFSYTTYLGPCIMFLCWSLSKYAHFTESSHFQLSAFNLFEGRIIQHAYKTTSFNQSYSPSLSIYPKYITLFPHLLYSYISHFYLRAFLSMHIWSPLELNSQNLTLNRGSAYECRIFEEEYLFRLITHWRRRILAIAHKKVKRLVVL